MEQNRNKNLIKNTFIISIGKLGTSSVSFFLLPLYTKVLTPGEYGTNDLIGTIQTILGIVFGLQLSNCIYRFLLDVRNNFENEKKLITNVLFVNFLSSLFLSISFVIVYFIFKPNYCWYLLIMVLISNFFYILQDTLRGVNRYVEYAIFGFLQTILLLISNIVLVLIYKKSVQGLLVSSILSQFIVSILILIRLKIFKKINLKMIDKTLIKHILSYSLPLVPNELSWWVIKGSDRLVISSMLSVVANGILSVSHKFPSAFIMFYNYFNTSWTETVILHLKDDDHEQYISNVINKVLYLSFGLGFGIIAVMPFIFNILVNEQYADAYCQIPIYMVATLFNILVGLTSCLYIANKNTKKVALTSFMSAAINILINLGTIKFIGIYAASISSLVAFCFLAIYRIIDTRKYCKVSFDKKFLFSSILCLAIILMTYYYKKTFFCFISLFFTAIYFIFYNRSIFFRLLKHKEAKRNKLNNGLKEIEK
ncbi:MAG: lipopolysaccharide biosynthesis protein [Peptoanaerobacter stomatis]|uniref:lipopolysaccharide biosynthesis protein n=1 Tax=Peptoanaerobacter stomatis TaxID=796937 RepID=UPI003F9F7777